MNEKVIYLNSVKFPSMMLIDTNFTYPPASLPSDIALAQAYYSLEESFH